MTEREDEGLESPQQAVPALQKAAEDWQYPRYDPLPHTATHPSQNTCNKQRSHSKTLISTRLKYTPVPTNKPLDQILNSKPQTTNKILDGVTNRTINPKNSKKSNFTKNFKNPLSEKNPHTINPTIKSWKPGKKTETSSGRPLSDI